LAATTATPKPRLLTQPWGMLVFPMRLTASRPVAILEQKYLPKEEMHQMPTHGMHQVGQGVEGMGGSQQQQQPTSLCPGSGTLVSFA